MSIREWLLNPRIFAKAQIASYERYRPDIQLMMWDLLTDAGFTRHHVYWQDEDEDGEASGEFFPTTEGENDPAWIAYIVGSK